MRGKEEARDMVTELDKETKGATTSINAFEVFFGAYKSAKKNENLEEAVRLIERLEVFPLDVLASRKAGELSAKLAEKGEMIDYRDALIAGIAIENSLTLVTRNKSHFSRIKNLKVVIW